MIDLTHWALTIPEQTPAKTIETPLLAAGYSSQYFTPDGSAIRFWAPVTGTSTNLSSFPRTELRETGADGRPYNWRYSEGTSYLRASLEVSQVPSSGKVVIGQIHASGNAYPFVKVQYRQVRGVGYVDLTVRHKPNDPESPVMLSYTSMPLNTVFDYALRMSPTGELDVNLNGLTYHHRLDPAWAKQALYFKAGLYVLDKSGPASEGGRAVFHSLEMGHRK
jgi:hypothetical protein